MTKHYGKTQGRYQVQKREEGHLGDITQDCFNHAVGDASDGLETAPTGRG